MRGPIAQVRPMLRNRLAGWPHPHKRRWTAAVAADLVDEVTPRWETGWRTAGVVVTSTSVAIATVIRSGSPLTYVVKIPWTASGIAGLRRQAEVLDMLEREPRLSGLRLVLPRCVDRGTIDNRHYLIEAGLPGVSASGLLRGAARRNALLRAATTVISGLHVCTREQAVLDRAAVADWVDVPLRRIEEYALARPSAARLLDAIGRLKEELVAALVGRTVHLSWIHGDYWPGNVLAAAPSGRVTGVVDWDCAATRQLPLHDLLHLRVFAHRLVVGGELGEIVVRALQHGIDKTLAVPVDDLSNWLDTIPQRAALLLYWLRHVLLFIDSEGDHDKPRWFRGNVERVLVHV